MVAKEIYLPALKGRFGIRFYYVALMTLANVERLIKVGKEIYTNDALSTMIQRELKEGRAKEIADYLRRREERFFNSMVVGVYGGAPDWKPFRIVSGVSDIDPSSLSLDTVNSFGFLKLSGGERLFPLDGQHRLAGIRQALKGRGALTDLAQEEISVIFVPHDAETATGRERSRRLFTTLNKKAKAVDQNEIIALDEDDVMAISCRWLVETYRPLMGERVWYTASTNIPPTGKDCLTTIGTLYLVLQVLFLATSGRSLPELRDNRPRDEWLSYYHHVAKTFFDALATSMPIINRYMSQANFGRIAEAQRSTAGGHLLFRPAGLRSFAETVAALVFKENLDEAETKRQTPLAAKRRAGVAVRTAVARVAALPMQLDSDPYAGLLWDRGRIAAGKRSLTRDLMLDMLQEYPRREKLRIRYAKALNREGERVHLPSEKAARKARRS
jgi:DNA sulfur modification protein DndB